MPQNTVKPTKKLIKYLLLSLLCAISALLQGQDTLNTLIQIGNQDMENIKKAVLSGKVSNPETGEVLIGATVYVTNLDVGTVTNDSGFYALILPVGRHEIIFSSIGLLETKRTVDLYTDGVLDIGLEERSYSLEEIVVRAKPNDQNIANVKTGVIELSVRDISTLPSLLGEVDVMNSLLLLPGVSTAGEGAAGINVRGGRIDQNLVLFGGAQLFNTSHALGLFSVFNPDLVGGFTLYKGSVPAQFGGRTASVLDVDIRDGDFDRWKIKGGLGTVNGRLLVEGPLSKGKLLFYWEEGYPILIGSYDWWKGLRSMIAGQTFTTGTAY